MADGNDRTVDAPLLGTVVRIAPAPGDTFQPGQLLVVLESMKMEHVVIAEWSGTVVGVLVEVGQTVDPGQPMLVTREGAVEATVDAATTATEIDAIRPDLAESVERHRLGLDEARPDSVERRRRSGQRTTRENVDDLCDAGSFVEYGPLAIAAQRRRRSFEDLITRTPADGLVSGVGKVDGHPTVVMSYDYTVLAGTQGVHNHTKKDRLFELAERRRLPVVLFA